MPQPTQTAPLRGSGPRIRPDALRTVMALRAVADGLRAAAVGYRAWSDPRDIAYAAGFDLAVGFPEQGERTTADLVLFQWHVDGRERGLSVFTELARACLLREGGLHRHDDVDWLAAELAVPHGAAVHLTLDELIDAQRYYPIPLLRDAYAVLRVLL